MAAKMGFVKWILTAWKQQLSSRAVAMGVARGQRNNFVFTCMTSIAKSGENHVPEKTPINSQYMRYAV